MSKIQVVRSKKKVKLVILIRFLWDFGFTKMANNMAHAEERLSDHPPFSGSRSTTTHFNTGTAPMMQILPFIRFKAHRIPLNSFKTIQNPSKSKRQSHPFQTGDLITLSFPFHRTLPLTKSILI
jgi:hypothetical protein